VTNPAAGSDDDLSQFAVHRDDAASRYEAWVGDQLVGVADFTLSGSVLSINHTGTEPAWRGRGIAGRLTRFALDDIRASGRKVRPVCPYTESFVDEHPDYRDLLA
jgi:uncharacterized protein